MCIPVSLVRAQFFCSLSLSILVLFGLSISKESNRKNESRCVVVHFFPLRADCFLPLVQRDLWRICWLERFRAKSDSYLISILYCCYYLSSSSNFCMASTWATYAQAHICVGLYQYKGFCTFEQDKTRNPTTMIHGTEVYCVTLIVVISLKSTMARKNFFCLQTTLIILGLESFTGVRLKNAKT